jgi:cytoskeleton protein RodZ
MNEPPSQDSLFEEPLGLRFRHAREQARLSLDALAKQLKLPVAVLDAIEREDWPRLGAPIFVRSYVGSYAKALGLPASIAEEVVRGKAAPPLNVVGAPSPSRRFFDGGVMKLAYLVMTLVIVGSVVMLAMYFQAPRRAAEVLPLDPPTLHSGIAGSVRGNDAAQGKPAPSDPTGPGATDGDAPVLASLTPQLPQAVPAAGGELVLRFRGESWVDLRGPDGLSLERGMVPAGAERRFGSGQLAQVTLGNAAAVEVSRAGRVIDLTPFREAKLARFTVSSDGRIAAVARD